MQVHKIIIVGGGAAGFFAAINAAEFAASVHKPVDIRILEFSGSVLKKVRISGGGRCNVTHHLFEPRLFCERYPRGAKELLSAFQRFQARDTVEWFKKHGVNLVAEEDGRMFPDTNTSETVIDCFLENTEKLGVQVMLNHRVDAIVKKDNGSFEVLISDKESMEADAVMIATGSMTHGHRFAKELGHTITDLAPSLFSFKIEDPLISELSGLSFPNASVKLNIPDEKPFTEKGPLLITHWGLSGPAVLKISAWAAREMKKCDYRANLQVNWLGEKTIESVLQKLKELKELNLRGQIQNTYPESVAKRFWLKILEKSNVALEKRWADTSNKDLQQIANILFATEFVVLGKNRYKDEFVECGGVSLKEINFKKMESKICPRLFFAGEVLDIDGITGGFNFQNAWSGAWIAAQQIIE
jgi:predicted Rossmann fold flavoprotein